MKSKRLVLTSLAVSVLVSSLLPVTVKAEASDAWVEKAMGRYQSQIWSGGGLLPGITEFRQTNEGTIAGSYTMNEQGTIEPGTLSQCRAMQLRVLRCIWNDKYGTGSLAITFSPNFTNFRGYWGSENSNPTFRWNGSR